MPGPEIPSLASYNPLTRPQDLLFSSLLVSYTCLPGPKMPSFAPFWHPILACPNVPSLAPLWHPISACQSPRCPPWLPFGILYMLAKPKMLHVAFFWHARPQDAVFDPLWASHIRLPGPKLLPPAQGTPFHPKMASRCPQDHPKAQHNSNIRALYRSQRRHNNLKRP